MQYTNRAEAIRQTGLTYLGNTNNSYKAGKNTLLNELTYILYLAPHKLSGYNVCPMATKHCIETCLHESGRNRINVDNTINRARIAKTKLFFEDRQFFMEWLVDEIMAAQQKAHDNGMNFSIRLNGTSDISPELFKLGNYNILDMFPEIQFYDYTKVPKKIALSNKYDNYDLTFSYSGENWDMCEYVLKNNVRVAVVFEKLPQYFNGYKVIDGDKTDVRYMDANNVIVGLKYKRVRQKIDIEKNPFIVTKKMLSKELVY